MESTALMLVLSIVLLLYTPACLILGAVLRGYRGERFLSKGKMPAENRRAAARKLGILTQVCGLFLPVLLLLFWLRQVTGMVIAAALFALYTFVSLIRLLAMKNGKKG